MNFVELLAGLSDDNTMVSIKTIRYFIHGNIIGVKNDYIVVRSENDEYTSYIQISKIECVTRRC